jgi:hypothetical protein
LSETRLVSGKVVAGYNEDATRRSRGARQRQFFEVFDGFFVQDEAYRLL